MILCGVIYVVLMIAVVLQRKQILFRNLEKKLARQMVLILLIVNTIALGLFVREHFEQRLSGVVYRNTYGSGNRKEEYQMTVGKQHSDSITIDVEERKYTSSEIRKLFAEVVEKLDTVILGENEGFDHVDRDLNLISRWKEYPIEIHWELEPYGVMDPYGKIQQEKTNQDGTLVELRGYLNYDEEEAVYIRSAMVYPRRKTQSEKLISDVQDLILAEQKKTRTEESFSLPEEIRGEKISWEKKKEGTGYYLLGLGVIAAILMVALKKQNEEKAQKERKEQMMTDYPEIINKFTLLLSTGMTTKNVWERIVENYEEQKIVSGERFAYEEMKNTFHEMQSGITEAQAYERFGKRCGGSVYMKFGVLLSQNLKKGSKGMTEVLRNESIQAFENRKARAKRRGEEAGTKLLAPMFAMLAVVLAIVIVPAFLSVRI